jgi:hypothetical protein
LTLASLVLTSCFVAQASPGQVIDSHSALPDDPAVLLEQSTPQTPATGSSSDPNSPSGAPTSPSATPTSPQAPASQNTAQDSAEAQRQKSAEILKQQEQQRIMGVMATFNTTTNQNAPPLTPGQKFQLYFKSEIDPWPFGLAAVIAGIGQADDSFPEYGQGMQGYAKRFGAAYGDAFIGNFWGNAVLPTILHEDPRYFQMGTGSIFRRALWASTSTVWCKRDNGSWGPNYSNVIGNLIGAAISNVYYPEGDRTVGQTFERGLTVSAEGIIGAELIEFWPDIARNYKRKRAEKLAKQQALQDAQDSANQPAPAPAPKP